MTRNPGKSVLVAQL